MPTIHVQTKSGSAHVFNNHTTLEEFDHLIVMDVPNAVTGRFLLQGLKMWWAEDEAGG